MQLPGGFLINRFGPRLTYGVSLAVWSIITMVQGLARSAGAFIGLRTGLGIAEAPAFPVNSRVVAAWFPPRERGFAIGVYTAGGFGGLAFLTPVLAFILTTWGWPAMFVICGAIGVIYAGFWLLTYRDPRQSRRVNEAELSYIREGGGLAETVAESRRFSWDDLFELLSHRQLWGIYIGQFAVGVTLWFFLTWFPSYLLASTIVLANYVSDINLVIAIMAIAFFAQGMSNISWTLVSEMAPRELQGLAGGVFNFFANLGSIATPLVVGFILAATNSFNGALVFISTVTLVGALSYIFIVGRVYRIQLQRSAS